MHKVAIEFIEGEGTKKAPGFEQLEAKVNNLPASERHGVWYWVGMDFHQDKRRREAMQCFVRALRHDPDSMSAAWNRFRWAKELPEELSQDLCSSQIPRTRGENERILAILEAAFGTPGA